jgi:hypothetical protein
VKKLFHHKTFVYAALLFWLFASASGMHGHYCYDGMEPPVSVHYDLLSSHNDDANLGHKDIDSKPQVSALKVTNLDLPFLAALFLLAMIWPIIRGQQFSLSKTPSSWLAVTNLRPPLRAPPAITA